MDEPSVLDYLKAKLTPWKKSRITGQEISAGEADREITGHPEVVPDRQELAAPPMESAQPRTLPWRSALALGLALIAQITLEPGPDRSWLPGVILYLISAASVVWAYKAGEWKLAPIPPDEHRIDPYTIKPIPALVGLVCAALVFITSGGNRFSLLNLSLLALALFCLLYAFWPSHRKESTSQEKLSLALDHSSAEVSRSNWSWFLLALLVGAIIFRFLHFNSLPPEMTSDHAEKILDVSRVLDGQTNIFFPNNGGREALHFYLIAALHKLFNLDLGYSILKLSTILVGLLALPFLYLLGIEIANRRVGWLAVAFAAVAYWPLVISRVGLRFPFYVLFTASTLYFLLHGIRTQSRAHFMLAGISLGLSFYGYSADRLLLILVAVGVGLYLLHRHSLGQRKQVLWLSLLLLVMAVVVLMPLLRYILDEPGNFLFRTLTRMGSLERPLPAPAWQIFLLNMGRALIMFFWEDGEVWLASIPHRPALEWITAALFFCGVILVFLRYLRSRHWLDLFLLLSITILMLPSVLALAFPKENPNLYRTGGAVVPVFLLVALAMDGFMAALEDRLKQPRGRQVAWGIAITLVFFTALQSYNLVFNQYFQQYRLSAWNSSEMGRLMSSFAELNGTTDNAWVIPYTHWVDTRLVGMNAGFPLKDYALSIDQLDTTLAIPGAKLFLIKPEDQAAITALGQMYPKGWFQEYVSSVPTKNFLVFLVPEEELPLEPELPLPTEP